MVGGRAILLLVFGLASGALSACGEVIGLGEEPRPLTAEDCKLPPARRRACTECMIDAACPESRACAANAECAEVAANCFSSCWEPNCPVACLQRLDGDARKLLSALMTKGTPCHEDCLPTEGSECEALAQKCCSAIENLEERGLCVNTALGGDEADCLSFHRRASSSYCPVTGD
jgi:hypothetical protein